MADQPQQHKEEQSPFSPLQTGCAVVMLTNMLIYFAVVAFVFNLLDPSKLDASYLARRGFTARPEPESEQDRSFRRIAEERREQQAQVQETIFESSRSGDTDQGSIAADLSELPDRPQPAYLPGVRALPSAKLTRGGNVSRGRAGRSSGRLYSDHLFRRISLPSPYEPLQVFVPRPQNPAARYRITPVELANAINFPGFKLPEAEQSGAYLYTPASPLIEPVRGGIRVSPPPAGAVTHYTNYLREAGKPASSEETNRD